MTDDRLLTLGPRPESTSTRPAGGAEKPRTLVEETGNQSRPAPDRPLWTRSGNNFRFNFFPGDSPTLHSDFTPSDSHVFTAGQGSAFAFNFHIPPDASGDMSAETSQLHPAASCCSHDENPSGLEEVNSPPEEPGAPQTKKKKKKKKSGKKTTTAEQEATAESRGGEDTQLSAEEQLGRELDWCIEQLELGVMAQKATAKQKEEASRALKTLRSSKAPLVKKRQVMRTMAGDYRKKMEEEKNKQFKLIQSELASAQVQAVSVVPKKSTFHRRAEANQKHGDVQDTNARVQTQDGASTFVFSASKQEFRFNFL